MFQRFFNKLTGAAEASSEREQQAFAELNELAPLSGKEPPEIEQELPPEEAFGRRLMVRETVLGRNQRVAGYEFRLNRSRREQIHLSTNSTMRLYDEVLLRNLMLADLDRLLGHRLAFIPLSIYSINNPLLDALTQRNVVLMLECTAECSTDFDSFVQSVYPRVKALHTAGVRIGMTRYNDLPVLAPFFQLADFILLDVHDLTFDQVQKQMEMIESDLEGKQLVARNVDGIEMMQACLKLPFQFFHGPFVMRREKWESRAMDSGRSHIIKLLQLVRKGAENEEIASAFKHDPTLTYKLLRYINSPASGLTNHISSIEQALLLLGQQPLYRWLTLLLFVSGDSEALDAALLETALIRGRIMELLWHEKPGSKNADELFVVGVLSMLDKLFRMPLQEILPVLHLQAEIEAALLEGEGPYAPYLALAIASEADDAREMEALALAVGVPAEKVNRFIVDALVWAQDMETAG